MELQILSPSVYLQVNEIPNISDEKMSKDLCQGIHLDP